MSKSDATNMPALMDDQAPVLFEKTDWVDGFTWRTLVGAIVVGLIMMPGTIYMGLISGVGVGSVAQWVTIIVFIEIGRRSFVKMKRQEIIVLFWVSAGVLAGGVAFGSGAKVIGGPFSGLIWNQYLAQSPQAAGFGIANEIPSWAVPSDHAVLLERTFFHRAWLIPILLMATMMLTQEVMSLAGGYFFYIVTNDMERLPYPMAPVGAGAATALEESSNKTEGWRWRIFSIGAMVGVAYGAIYLVLPTLTGALATEPIMIIPIPFADWTIQIGQSKLMQAAIFGLATDLGILLSGFVVPFSVVFGSFVGCILCNIILNPILFHYGILHHWKAGMSVVPTSIVNGIDFWISVAMGLGLAVAIFGFYTVIKRLIASRGARADAFTPEEVEDLKGRGHFPLWLAGLFIVTFILADIGLCHVLVPDFPVWILFFFGLVYSPVVSYTAARMQGITGSAAGTAFPYLREAAFVFSGYKGAAIWFAPVPLYNLSGAETFKQLELTRTKFVSLIKARAATICLVFIFSLVFWSLVWRMGRIPSSTYPFVQKMWPFQAVSQCLWASSTLASDRLGSESLANDFEANPIMPNDSTPWITPRPEGDKSEGGYKGYLHDFRPGAISGVELPKDKPIMALVNVDQPDSVLDGLDPQQIKAVLIVVPQKLSVQQVEELRTRFVKWPNARYWVLKDRIGQFLEQMVVTDPVTIQYRENFLKQAINVKYIGAGLLSAAVLFSVLALLGFPSSFGYGALGGVAMWPHMAIPAMIGALLGRYIFAKRIGPKKWKAYTPVLLAGYGCGYGLIGTVATAIALMSKAVSMIVL